VLSLHPRSVRRLAIARAGLGQPERTGLGRRAAGTGARARAAACEVVRRFGYLQLDTVSVSGARSHTLVLMSRLDGVTPALAETLLAPGTPLFEYWGHEACWLPLELYPYMEFRRREFATHPWWGDVIGEHPRVARTILDRLAAEGPLKAVEFKTGPARAGWWDLGAAKKVLSALWSRGDVAIRQRTSFQREFDLAERVIPGEIRCQSRDRAESVRHLLLRALAGHGWATTGTLAATWRFRNMAGELADALAVLCESGDVMAATVETDAGRRAGWIRPQDAELAETLSAARPRQDRGVLLSPFDPLRSGIEAGRRRSSDFVRRSRYTSPRHSANSATTACRFSPATVSSAGLISKRFARRAGCALFPTIGKRQCRNRAIEPLPTSRWRDWRTR